MLKWTVVFAGVVAAAALSESQLHAQGVLTEKNISFEMAKTIAETTLEACRRDGSHISVTVLDRSGNVRVAFRDDGAEPHTAENSQKKAYTARTFGAPSADLAKRLSASPGGVAQVNLTGVIALGGGLPIKVGKETIGAVGVSGSQPGGAGVPGGTRDEACAKAGIDKVADQLK
jgi:uncharacterized protein GlcG (DUF336 family)